MIMLLPSSESSIGKQPNSQHSSVDMRYTWPAGHDVERPRGHTQPTDLHRRILPSMHKHEVQGSPSFLNSAPKSIISPSSNTQPCIVSMIHRTQRTYVGMTYGAVLTKRKMRINFRSLGMTGIMTIKKPSETEHVGKKRLHLQMYKNTFKVTRTQISIDADSSVGLHV